MLNTLACLAFVLFEVHGQMTSPTSTCSSTAWDASEICRVIEELNALKSIVLELRQQIVNMQGSYGIDIHYKFTCTNLLHYNFQQT